MELTFTIIIPTRERCDTLRPTLQTCVTQDYKRLEIIVSDNLSQDNTRQVVESFHDSRIRYINTGRRVGMSTNWEFALSHASGDYVTILGDDDGMLPDAVNKIAGTIASLDEVEAFVWGRPIYNWPNHINPGKRNRLTLPSRLGKANVKLDSGEMLRRLVNHQCNWGGLPSLYNGFVHSDVIERVKKRGNGRFFNSAIPDIYSAIAIAGVTESFYVSARPFAIAGISHHSTGHSFSYSHAAPQSAQRFLVENEIPIHPQMVMTSSQAICTAECYLQAQALGLTPQGLQFDLKRVIQAALLEASEESDLTFATVLSDLRQVGTKNGLEAFVASAIQHSMHSPEVNGRPISGYDLRHNALLIDCRAFGVQDVYEATLLCERLFDRKPYEFLFPFGTIEVTVRAFYPFVKKRLHKTLKNMKKKDPDPS
jgi:hypothetical protein